MPECRLCHVQIDKTKEKENVDWIMPSRNYYFHKSCYETWKAQPTSDDDWVKMIYDFLARDMKVSYDYFLCEAQIKKFWKENKINPKGIFFTLKYFYEIKHNSWEKGHGGLGIVPYVFSDAKAYWIEQERKKRGFVKELEQQAKTRSIIRLTRKEKSREKYNLDDIGGEE